MSPGGVGRAGRTSLTGGHWRHIGPPHPREVRQEVCSHLEDAETWAHRGEPFLHTTQPVITTVTQEKL